jgi:hypothetical protein
MAEWANILSRNPNVCASCSSLADGMDDANQFNPAVPNSAPVAHDCSLPVAPEACEDSLQPLAALSSVWGGGGQPPRGSGAAE